MEAKMAAPEATDSTEDRVQARGAATPVPAQAKPQPGTPAPESVLVDVPRLVTAYFALQPDPAVATQRVAFGTSGHRGSSFDATFNEWHVAAITQAICEYRAREGIDGPLFLGADTHALSAPAIATALEVLAANGVETMLAVGDDYVPTPALSYAILVWNRGRSADARGRADGIVVTPSHNPPEGGGFKYNPPHGGPADSTTTGAIEQRANALLAAKLDGVRRMPWARALAASTTRRHDYRGAYVRDLASVLDLDAIRASGVRMGVDPLGGAGVHYWPDIADRYRLDLTIVRASVDPTFRFMTLDWDGRIRMDPSSPDAMQGLIRLKDRFDIAFACDTDHDRHGIVTRSEGLMPPNHYLAVSIAHLFAHRAQWPRDAAIGKTAVSSSMIDRVAAGIGRRVIEVPVGFKWFVDGLLAGSLGFCGEESAGASFLRQDARVWTTDKDGIIPGLLSAEIIAKSGRDPAEAYRALTAQYGESAYDRVDRPATPEQKKRLAKLSPSAIRSTALAGEKIEQMLVAAPGNGQPLGGLKVVAKNGWFAARPSGTENLYKIYAESFNGSDHLARIVDEAQEIVNDALAG
jgi:phosphoglucomutase